MTILYVVAGTQAAGVALLLGGGIAMLGYLGIVLDFPRTRAPLPLPVLALVVIGLVWRWAANLHPTS